MLIVRILTLFISHKLAIATLDQQCAKERGDCDQPTHSEYSRSLNENAKEAGNSFHPRLAPLFELRSCYVGNAPIDMQPEIPTDRNLEIFSAIETSWRWVESRICK